MNIFNLIERNLNEKGKMPHSGLISMHGFLFLSIFKRYFGNGRLSSKAIIHCKLSSIKGCLPLKVSLHRRSPSIQGYLPMKAIFHRKLSSIKGRLPSNVVFCPWAAPEVPLKWIKQYELGRLDNKLTGTGRQADRRTDRTTYWVRLTLWLKRAYRINRLVNTPLGWYSPYFIWKVLPSHNIF